MAFLDLASEGEVSFELSEMIALAREQILGDDLALCGQLMSPLLSTISNQNRFRRHPSVVKLEFSKTSSLELFRARALRETSIDDCFVLGWHRHPVNGVMERTILGDWLYRAKPYDHVGFVSDPSAIEALIVTMSIVIRGIPSLSRSDLVVWVPSSNPLSTNCIPRLIAGGVEELCHIPIAHDGTITKIRTTGPMKGEDSFERKESLIRNTMEADVGTFRGKRVLVIDDILDSGLSARETARSLKTVGASHVSIITHTKTHAFVDKTLGKVD